MKAKKIHKGNTPTVHHYTETKVNKRDTIYSINSLSFKPTLLTPLVKIEDFQGFSKANNFLLYFRIKDRNNWKDSTAVTGLFKTSYQGIYYGNYLSGQKCRTLLIFILDPEGESLKILEYPKGYYPRQVTIERIADELHEMGLKKGVAV